MKKCIKCGIEKPMDQFHNAKHKADGRQNTCKICQNNWRKSYDKKRRAENNHIKFINITDSHYCLMYEMLRRAGYSPDANISIHEQFCLKHGFTPDKVLLKKFRDINHSDCK